jgi:hypothetical protein
MYHRIMKIKEVYNHDDKLIFTPELLQQLETKYEDRYIEELLRYQTKISQMEIIHSKYMEAKKKQILQYENSINELTSIAIELKKELENLKQQKNRDMIKVNNMPTNIGPLTYL